MRLLVLRIGAMGDVLHTLPSVAALRALRPRTHIGWAIDPRWLPLLESSTGDRPLVDSIHLVPTRLWKSNPFSPATVRSLAGLRRELRAAHYDLAVDLQGTLRSAVVGRFASARVFAGSATPREAPARRFYKRRYPVFGTHVVPQTANLLGDAANLPLVPAPVLLPHDPAAEAAVEQLVSPLPPTSLVLLVPQAGWGAKQWPPERFGALARELQQRGFTPLVNALGPSDPLAAAVVEASGHVARPVDLPLAQLIALTRRVRLVVAGDTGPLHLAAALQRPVVALFGPTNPARNGPWNTPSRVLRHPISQTDHRRHAAPEEGLLQLTTAQVLESALQLLHDPALHDPSDSPADPPKPDHRASPSS